MKPQHTRYTAHVASRDTSLGSDEENTWGTMLEVRRKKKVHARANRRRLAKIIGSSFKSRLCEEMDRC